MSAIVIKHRVADFATWLKAYEQHGATRSAAGALSSTVCQSEDDPNSVMVYIEVESLDKAREFLASEDLQQTMQSAGVLEQPTVHFMSSARQYAS